MISGNAQLLYSCFRLIFIYSCFRLAQLLYSITGALVITTGALATITGAGHLGVPNSAKLDFGKTVPNYTYFCFSTT